MEQTTVRHNRRDDSSIETGVWAYFPQEFLKFEYGREGCWLWASISLSVVNCHVRVLLPFLNIYLFIFYMQSNLTFKNMR